MADYFGAAQSLLGGAGSLFSGLTSSAGSRDAAKFYNEAAGLTNVETGIKEMANQRQVFQTIGGGIADVAANGLEQSGSAMDLLRSSAQQGAMSKALIDLQGDIQSRSYLAQSASATAQAKAQSGGGFLSGLGSVVGAAAAIFSDDRMKENIKLLHRREDGIGVYRFNYTIDPDKVRFVGVLASEVEKLRPDAVKRAPGGLRMVDYDAIGVKLQVYGAHDAAYS